LLWLAEGRPDEVPLLPGAAEAEPREEALDGATLYQEFTCAGCHGPSGEGGVGPALNQVELPTDEIVEVSRNGQGTMTGYRPDVLSDAQLDAVVEYVRALGRGEVQLDLDLEKRPLPSLQVVCSAGRAMPRLLIGCGGN
jgi:mono/diheme cytochrome c family protein